jgi:hypothetical protein
MQAIQPIQNLLDELQNLYDNPANQSHQVYYSKLALLELCGWLEVVLDDIVLTYARAKLTSPANLDQLNNEIVGKTYGCSYKSNFRNMLLKTIGLCSVEKLENELTRLGLLTTLKGQLETLVGLRNGAAHTTIAGVMPTFQAPAVMKRYLVVIYPILVTVETELQRL